MSDYLDFKPWLRKDANLKDDTTARENLSLGTAAIINTGDKEDELPTNKVVQQNIVINNTTEVKQITDSASIINSIIYG